jgi:hypothetical protein
MKTQVDTTQKKKKQSINQQKSSKDPMHRGLTSKN